MQFEARGTQAARRLAEGQKPELVEAAQQQTEVVAAERIDAAAPIVEAAEMPEPMLMVVVEPERTAAEQQAEVPEVARTVAAVGHTVEVVAERTEAQEQEPEQAESVRQAGHRSLDAFRNEGTRQRHQPAARASGPDNCHKRLQT